TPVAMRRQPSRRRTTWLTMKAVTERSTASTEARPGWWGPGLGWRAVAIILCIVSCAAAAAPPESAVPATEQTFAKGTFYQLTPWGWFNLSWTEPGRVTVTSPTPAPDGNPSPPVTIRVRSEQQQRLQSLLGQLADPPAAERGSYVLDLKPGEAGARRLVWSPPEETAQLAQLRSDLDQMGHLAYHVAVHALARGRKEAERGEDEHACTTYLAGLDALGDRYLSS